MNNVHYFPFGFKTEKTKIELNDYFISCLRIFENNKDVIYSGSIRGRPLTGCLVKPIPRYTGMVITPENLSRQSVTNYQVNEVFPQYMHWNVGFQVNNTEHKFLEEWIDIANVLHSD